MKPNRVRWMFAAVAALVVSLGFAPLRASGQATVGWVEIEGTPLDQPDPFGSILGGSGPTFLDLINGLNDAAERDDLDAVVLRLRQPALTLTHVEELGRVIARVRASGKKVHLFTEIYGPAEVVLAAHCDEAIMQTGGALSLPGLHMEEMFLADALGWLGLKMDYVQIGDYKGASEQLGSSAPSKAWDENISQLLDSLYAAMRGQIKAGRGMTDAELDRAMEMGFFASGELAIRAGLIDAEMDRLDMAKHLEGAYGGEITYRTNLIPDGADMLDGAAMANPFAFLQMLAAPVEQGPTRNTIAILDIAGPIIDGESTPASILGGASVGALTIRQALNEIADEPLVKGVVVRVDSPGGSAIASESIWQGITRVAERKPVWVSVGSMAASGGYYVAVAGDKIYLGPSSIVGSIGVVGGKMVLGGAYEKIGVNVVTRDRGPAAGLLSTIEPWTPAQRELIRSRMKETYDIFVERVRAGREGIDIARTAEGRLFAGERAIEMGMADAIGGLDDAVRDLAAEVGLVDGRYDVLRYPAPKSLDEALRDMLGGFGLSAQGARNRSASTPGVEMSAALAALRALVGPAAWPTLRDALAAMWTLRNEPVVLTAPRTLLRR